MRRNLFWLSDEQWCRIEPHLPRDVRGKERVNDRLRITTKAPGYNGIMAPGIPE